VSDNLTIHHLRTIIKTLQSVPDEQFNMEHWWLKDGLAFDEERNKLYKVSDGPCGCPIGHLIQRGLLSEAVLETKDVPSGALPYEYREHIWIQVSDALKLNTHITQFLFDHYAYHRHRAITRNDVIRRIKFIIAELNYHIDTATEEKI
jgi:hypothetical protein